MSDMLQANMGHSKLMVHVPLVEESRKRKHIRAGNRSRKTKKNFSRKSNTKIRDKTRFKKGLSHQGQLCSSKVRYDRDSEPRVKINSEVDLTQEGPPCRKCGKLHERGCMRVSNSCYNRSEPGHMMKNCPYMRGREKGKEKVQPNDPSEEAQKKQRGFALNSRGVGEDTSGDVSGV